MPVHQTTERWIVNEDGSKVRGVVPVEPVEAETSTTVPRTHAEADEQAVALGIEFPEDVQTVKEKQAFLEQHQV